MRFKARSIFTTAFLMSGVVAVAHAIANADDPIDGADAPKVFPRTYPLTDLPVWSPDGKTFNATLVKSYIKTTIDAKAWETTSTMMAYSQNSCLVIATTPRNHDAIQDLLAKLRATGVKSTANSDQQ